ncbi:MAG: hypothetical protein U9N48_05330 [Euryarchaeota archaeon]|nr:hypothetical protein [Euryarchaeota archaeon]
MSKGDRIYEPSRRVRAGGPAHSLAGAHLRRSDSRLFRTRIVWGSSRSPSRPVKLGLRRWGMFQMGGRAPG